MPSPKLLPLRSPNPTSPPALISVSNDTNPAATATPAAAATALPAPDIEMDNLGSSGHRRRRSSLLSAGSVTRDNSGNSTNSSRSNGSRDGFSRAAGGSRPRGRSLRLAGRPDDIMTTRSTPRIPEDGIPDGLDAWAGGSAGKYAAYDGADDDSSTDGFDYDEGTLFDADNLQDDEETGLSRQERKRRRKARRLRTHFDQRFVRGSEAINGDPNSASSPPLPPTGTITADERKEADKNVLRRLLLNGTLIGLWYVFSLSISLYNKWMFGEDPEKLNFPFPLFTTSVHMLVQFCLSALVLYFVPSLRPGGAPKPKRSSHEIVSDTDEEGEDVDDAFKPEDENEGVNSRKKTGTMTRWFYLTRIGPCGAATGLDIGLGNMSLKFITLTFYTMCKSSSLAFVLLFAFFFRLEKPTWRLVGIIATMTGGVIMMVAGQVEFKLGGFLLVMSAAFFSGFRWGLTQIMLLRNPATSNPFSSIFYLAPVMFLTLFVIAVPTEGFGALLEGLRRLLDEWGPVRTPVLIIFPGTIAFLMTASEFALLQRTSVVTLSIAGIFKEVVTIATATLVFGDTLTLVNLLGLIVTMTAITAYNYIKITRMRQKAQIDVHRGHSRQRSLPSEANDGEAETFQSAGGEGPVAMGQYATGLVVAGSHEFAIASSSTSATTSPTSATHAHRGAADEGAEVEADTEDAGLLRKNT